jgi:hypothetical protein
MNVQAVSNFSSISSPAAKAAAKYIGTGVAQGGVSYASFAKSEGVSLLTKAFNWLTKTGATATENGLSNAYNWVASFFTKAAAESAEAAAPTAFKFLSSGQTKLAGGLNAASPVIGAFSAYGALRNLTKGIETLLGKATAPITSIIEKVAGKAAHVVS